MYPDEFQAQTGGNNEVPPNIYPQIPQYNDNYVKSVEYFPNNDAPVPYNQNPNIQYFPPPPPPQNVSQYYTANQSNQNLLMPQNDILNKIMEKQNKLAEQIEKGRMEDKMEALKKENENLRHQQLMNQVQANKEILGAQINGIRSQQPININNVNDVKTDVKVNVNVNSRRRLIFSTEAFCALLLLNIFFPGIGTIVAGVLYGNTVFPSKTANLICRGIIQMATYPIVIGWIWALCDAINSFEDGHLIC